MGKSSSKSQSSTSNTTQSWDNRVVNESGIVATGGGSVVANIESIDGAIVKNALDYASDAGKQNSADFGKLIDFAANVFTTGSGVQQQAIDAVQTAQNDAKGALDQKTILIAMGLGVAALAVTKGK